MVKFINIKPKLQSYKALDESKNELNQLIQFIYFQYNRLQFIITRKKRSVKLKERKKYAASYYQENAAATDKNQERIIL